MRISLSVVFCIPPVPGQLCRPRSALKKVLLESSSEDLGRVAEIRDDLYGEGFCFSEVQWGIY